MWPQGLMYLLVLAPFFFWSYGWANHHSASLGDVPSLVFDWERHIPLWPWTILPYWSIDLFYGLSLLLAGTRLELHRQALRLLTAQLICVTCFALWPLRFSTSRGAVDGWAGQLFDALMGFDLPYNQAPSLHIVLLLILWDFYRQRLSGIGLQILHAWSLLIGVSVLTTYQHHFIDIPTGLLAGSVCLWCWPLQGDRPRWQWVQQPARWRMAALYALGGTGLGALAWWLGPRDPCAWWLVWPVVSLTLVAAIYAGLGESGFQKGAHGRQSVGAWLLLAPYQLMAWLNARAWTWSLAPSQPVRDGVWLGRMPLPWEADYRKFEVVLDTTAELQGQGPGVQAWPMLDLVVPPPQALLDVASGIESAQKAGAGPVLVCCALGFSRSAAAVATWLCLSGRAADVGEAIEVVRRARPQVVIRPGLREAIERAVAQSQSGVRA
jgi:protein-tyrosine phosphatase